MTFLVKIKLDEELQPKSVQLGQKLVLECQITGFPRPAYTWYKDGTRISSISRPFVLNDIDWGHR